MWLEVVSKLLSCYENGVANISENDRDDSDQSCKGDGEDDENGELTNDRKTD